MKVSKIQLSESVQYHDGLWRRFRVEVDLDDTDSTKKAWQLAEDEIKAAKNRYEAPGPLPILQTDYPPLRIEDDEIEKVKASLSGIPYREDAITYIEVAGFRYTKELNDIANSKPSKNGR